MPALREIYFGLWDNLCWKEVEEQYPLESKMWLDEFPLRSVPGVEAYADFMERVETAIASLVSESMVKSAAIVTHRGVLQIVLRRFFNVSEVDSWSQTAVSDAVLLGDPNRCTCEVVS